MASLDVNLTRPQPRVHLIRLSKKILNNLPFKLPHDDSEKKSTNLRKIRKNDRRPKPSPIANQLKTTDDEHKNNFSCQNYVSEASNRRKAIEKNKNQLEFHNSSPKETVIDEASGAPKRRKTVDKNKNENFSLPNSSRKKTVEGEDYETLLDTFVTTLAALPDEATEKVRQPCSAFSQYFQNQILFVCPCCPALFASVGHWQEHVSLRGKSWDLNHHDAVMPDFVEKVVPSRHGDKVGGDFPPPFTWTGSLPYSEPSNSKETIKEHSVPISQERLPTPDPLQKTAPGWKNSEASRQSNKISLRNDLMDNGSLINFPVQPVSKQLLANPNPLQKTAPGRKNPIPNAPKQATISIRNDLTEKEGQSNLAALEFTENDCRHNNIMVNEDVTRIMPTFTREKLSKKEADQKVRLQAISCQMPKGLAPLGQLMKLRLKTLAESNRSINTLETAVLNIQTMMNYLQTKQLRNYKIDPCGAPPGAVNGEKSAQYEKKPFSAVLPTVKQVPNTQKPLDEPTPVNFLTPLISEVKSLNPSGMKTKRWDFANHPHVFSCHTAPLPSQQDVTADSASSEPHETGPRMTKLIDALPLTKKSKPKKPTPIDPLSIPELSTKKRRPRPKKLLSSRTPLMISTADAGTETDPLSVVSTIFEENLSETPHLPNGIDDTMDYVVRSSLDAPMTPMLLGHQTTSAEEKSESTHQPTKIGQSIPFVVRSDSDAPIFTPILLSRLQASQAAQEKKTNQLLSPQIVKSPLLPYALPTAVDLVREVGCLTSNEGTFDKMLDDLIAKTEVGRFRRPKSRTPPREEAGSSNDIAGWGPGFYKMNTYSQDNDITILGSKDVDQRPKSRTPPHEEAGSSNAIEGWGPGFYKMNTYSQDNDITILGSKDVDVLETGGNTIHIVEKPSECVIEATSLPRDLKLCGVDLSKLNGVTLSLK